MDTTYLELLREQLDEAEPADRHLEALVGQLTIQIHALTAALSADGEQDPEQIFEILITIGTATALAAERVLPLAKGEDAI